MFGWRRKRDTADTDVLRISPEAADNIVKGLTRDMTRAANRLITDFAADYIDDQTTQQHLDMMLVELDSNSLLWRKCAFKFAWTVQLIREAVKDFEKLKSQSFMNTRYQEGRQKYRDIALRLRECQQTMDDLDKAAKGISTAVFEPKHPSNRMYHELGLQAQLLPITFLHKKLKKELSTYTKANRNEIASRLKHNSRNHIATIQMMYARNPFETQEDIARINNEYSEIKHLLRNTTSQ